MTSGDNQQYVTVELMNVHMSRIEALLERNLALTRADIADMKAELKGEINDLRTELKGEINDLRLELKGEIAEVRSDVRVQSTRIDDLVHWNYWMIAFIVALFMLPSVIDGIKGFFKAVTDGVIAMFSQKKKD